MNAWGHLVGVVIVLLLVIFIGIWLWAWLPRHKRNFERLARIPMDDPARTDGRKGASPAPHEEGELR